MERSENRDADHIIDIETKSVASSPGSDNHHDGERASSSSTLPHPQSSLASSNGANSRNSRRREGYGRPRRSLFDSGIWISIELLVTLSQIIASIAVLSLSRYEKAQALLLAWVIGYASGCVAILPILYWDFLNRNLGTEQDSTPGTDEEDHQTAVSSARNAQRTLNSWVNVLVVYRFKRALRYFFAMWITAGNVWTFSFGWLPPSANAPSFYRLCIWFLNICCLGCGCLYFVFGILCCCCLCFRPNHIRGAATETINILPTYKFKLKDRNGEDQDTNSGVGESGGTLEAGTGKERTISGEDLVCCICFEEYADNDELRELPCAHFFHVNCVDKWLTKNCLCPLCKRDIEKTGEELHTSAVNPNPASASE